MTSSEDKEEKPWHKGEPCVLGIDEAGRGPVLGPMVYAAAFCPKSSLADLNKLGADDSKQLTEAQREALREKIDRAPFLRTVIHELMPDEISQKMLRKDKYNLNAISHDTALGLVHTALEQGVDIREVYVDTVGSPEQYAAKFRNRFPQLTKVVVAKKADATYRIVGAASIVAKTTRDRTIRQWQFVEEKRVAQFGEGDLNVRVTFPHDTGSGYPGDPLTKKWLEESCDTLFGFPTIVRFSWGTTRKLLTDRCIQVDWEADEDDEDEPSDSQKQAKRKTKDIKSFFVSSSAERPAKKKKVQKAPNPKFLQTRSLRRVVKLI